MVDRRAKLSPGKELGANRKRKKMSGFVTDSQGAYLIRGAKRKKRVWNLGDRGLKPYRLWKIGGLYKGGKLHKNHCCI